MNSSHIPPSITSQSDAFWYEMLHNYEIERLLSLPSDRQRISSNDRTCHAWSTIFNFDTNLSCVLLNYASLMNTTLDYLTFTCYYVFLFKLTNGEKDLCIGRKIDRHHQSDSHHSINRSTKHM